MDPLEVHGQYCRLQRKHRRVAAELAALKEDIEASLQVQLKVVQQEALLARQEVLAQEQARLRADAEAHLAAALPNLEQETAALGVRLCGGARGFHFPHQVQRRFAVEVLRPARAARGVLLAAP